MPGWLKKAIGIAAIFILCWGCAITYWRTAENAPATAELALALLAAPLALLGVLWLGKKAVAARPASTASAATAPAAQPAAAPSAPPLAILAAALRAPHGASPDELAAAIVDHQARPELDPELVDDAGFPITSARSEEAVDNALQEEIGAWLMLNGMPELQLGETHWRALTLGTAVVRDLAHEALMQLLPEEGAPPSLRLLPILPAAWTVEQRHAAGLWFKHVVAQFGWPVDHLTRIEAAPDSAPAGILGECMTGSGAPHSQVATLLLACDSHISQDTVDAWAANGSLCTAAQAQGRIPGEGAAGLLLAGLDLAQRSSASACVHVYPLAAGRREIASDSAKRPDTKRFTELAQRAVDAGGVPLDSVATIIADADHRASRALELGGLASASLPQLDATADVVRTGATIGSCGAVPFIGALALARQAALAQAAPALFVSNDDPYVCSMALVSLAPAAAGAA